ncbi:MAG: DUF2306 domain-containing protein [Alphaproteobacteria bacterium]|nr:DUF2306 domain-containing protein [Alphaproteobacteria bacterium]
MTTTFQQDGFPAALGLIALSLVPAIAGMVRLGELTGGAVTPESIRFFADPLPVVTHILCSLVFALAGALQFAPFMRRRWPTWHRHAGRVLVIAGLLSAETGLHMTLVYDLPATDGEALNVIRVFVGVAMMISLVIGIAAARQGDIVTHRAYMIRAYAIALGAGTQVLTHLPYLLLIGTPDETMRTVLMGAGWAINMVYAEWLIRRTVRRRAFVAGAYLPAA